MLCVSVCLYRYVVGQCPLCMPPTVIGLQLIDRSAILYSVRLFTSLMPDSAKQHAMSVRPSARPSPSHCISTILTNRYRIPFRIIDIKLPYRSCTYRFRPILNDTVPIDLHFTWLSHLSLRLFYVFGRLEGRVSLPLSDFPLVSTPPLFLEHYLYFN